MFTIINIFLVFCIIISTFKKLNSTSLVILIIYSLKSSKMRAIVILSLICCGLAYDGGIYVYHKDGIAHYVGATIDFARRYKEHLNNKDYYASYVFEKIPASINQLYETEKLAIQKYKPLANKYIGGNGIKKSGSWFNFWNNDIKLPEIGKLKDINSWHKSFFNMGINTFTSVEVFNKMLIITELVSEIYQIVTIINEHKTTITELNIQYNNCKDDTIKIINKLDNIAETYYDILIDYLNNDIHHPKFKKIHKYFSNEIEALNKVKMKCTKPIEEINKIVEINNSQMVLGILGTLALNIIIPGFSVVEAIAIGATAIKTGINMSNNNELYELEKQFTNIIKIIEQKQQNYYALLELSKNIN